MSLGTETTAGSKELVLVVEPKEVYNFYRETSKTTKTTNIRLVPVSGVMIVVGIIKRSSFDDFKIARTQNFVVYIVVAKLVRISRV